MEKEARMKWRWNGICKCLSAVVLFRCSDYLCLFVALPLSDLMDQIHSIAIHTLSTRLKEMLRGRGRSRCWRLVDYNDCISMVQWKVEWNFYNFFIKFTKYFCHVTRLMVPVVEVITDLVNISFLTRDVVAVLLLFLWLKLKCDKGMGPVHSSTQLISSSYTHGINYS